MKITLRSLYSDLKKVTGKNSRRTRFGVEQQQPPKKTFGQKLWTNKGKLLGGALVLGTGILAANQGIKINKTAKDLQAKNPGMEKEYALKLSAAHHNPTLTKAIVAKQNNWSKEDMNAAYIKKMNEHGLIK